MRRLLLSSSALVVGLAAVAAVGAPAVADSVSPNTCLSDCTAVFDTAGAHSFTAPAAATSLTVTVNGAAGAPASQAITNDSTALGGAGGSATVDLGVDGAGVTFDLGVGATGAGSSVSTDGDLLVLAGGGGGGGYVGRLDLPGQIFGTYPGGAGGSPTTVGVTPGATATAFGANPANGQGATAAPGAGGIGLAPGSAGSPSNGIGSVPGGAGGSRDIVVSGAPVTHTGGAGGGGYAGGGGGAVTQVDAGDDIIDDLVAPGGGGSGFLAAGLTATAGEPNAGPGSVTFTWSFSPAASTGSTTVHPGDSVTVDVTGLPANVAFDEVLDGAIVASGTSDADGAATVTFTVPAGQRAGAFPVQTLVDGVLAASTSAVTVVVDPAAATPSGSGTPAALAATGSDLPVGGMSAGALLIAAGAVLLVARRRIAAVRGAR